MKPVRYEFRIHGTPEWCACSKEIYESFKAGGAHEARALAVIDDAAVASTPTLGQSEPPQAGTWTLIAPDGRQWQAEHPLRTVALECNERICPTVQLERILRAADEPWHTCEESSECAACDADAQEKRKTAAFQAGQETDKAMIRVSADALREVLQALVGPAHLIREIQATRNLHALGHPNPINTLIEEHSAAFRAKRESGQDITGRKQD